MTSQADELVERLSTDAALRQRIAATHRGVLTDAGIAHDELSDDELAATAGGASIFHGDSFDIGYRERRPPSV
ncbi:MAG: hypothetical protein AAGF73_15630 [Actinomycetota bacterium]